MRLYISPSHAEKLSAKLVGLGTIDVRGEDFFASTDELGSLLDDVLRCSRHLVEVALRWTDDDRPVVYVLRVVAYGLIVIGILDKNRPQRP